MGADELVEELAEKLAKPEKTGPVYLSVAPPINHAMRRAAKLAQKRRQRTFDRWWMRMLALGINPEDVLAERKRKAEERRKADVRSVQEAQRDREGTGESAA